MSELGSKRTCPSCGAKFYDLGKRPADCPKCGKQFDPEALPAARKPRKVRVPRDAAEPKVVQHLDETDEDIDLSGFEDAEDVGAVADDIESLDELDEDIEVLSEIGEREREDDIVNSDDAEDDAFIEEMDEVETIIDRPEEDEDSMGKEED